MRQAFSTRSRLSVHLLILLGVLAALCSARPALGQFSGPGYVSVPPPASLFPITTDTNLLFPQGQDVHIAAGDQLTIHVFGQNEYSPAVLVDTTGNVYLPFLGQVQLAGLTTIEADELIHRDLQDAGIYRDPQVTMQVTPGPSSVATLTGEMKGVVPIVGSRPLLQVLSAVAGSPPTATASRVIAIQRAGVDEPILVDVGGDPTHTKASNIPILPGDTLIISRIGVVYMLGAFKNPGTIALTNYAPLTLSEAASLTGGYTFEGKYSDLRIIRTVGSHRTVVKANIKRVLYGKDPDPILQANDIVFLPLSDIKASVTNGTLGTALGLFSVIYSVILTARYN